MMIFAVEQKGEKNDIWDVGEAFESHILHFK